MYAWLLFDVGLSFNIMYIKVPSPMLTIYLVINKRSYFIVVRLMEMTPRRMVFWTVSL